MEKHESLSLMTFFRISSVRFDFFKSLFSFPHSQLIFFDDCHFTFHIWDTVCDCTVAVSLGLKSFVVFFVFFFFYALFSMFQLQFFLDDFIAGFRLIFCSSDAGSWIQSNDWILSKVILNLTTFSSSKTVCVSKIKQVNFTLKLFGDNVPAD